MIQAGEYRYISPVFTYDKKTGAIKRLLNAALTNNPALDGMDAVAASQFLSTEGEDMQLEQLLAALHKLTDQNETADAESVLANLTTLFTSKDDAIAALKTAADHPDPAKFVSIDVMKSLQNEVTALKAEKIEREADEVVEVALSEGKLLSARKTGRAEEQVDNTGGANGAKSINVRRKKYLSGKTWMENWGRHKIRT